VKRREKKKKKRGEKGVKKHCYGGRERQLQRFGRFQDPAFEEENMSTKGQKRGGKRRPS